MPLTEQLAALVDIWVLDYCVKNVYLLGIITISHQYLGLGNQYSVELSSAEQESCHIQFRF
jgi:hypothetical protein